MTRAVLFLICLCTPFFAICQIDFDSKEEVAEPEELHRLRLELATGAGYTLGSVPTLGNQALENYIRGTRYGQFLGGAFQYYVSERIGLGLYATSYFSRNEAPLIDYDAQGNQVQGMAKDNINVFLIGPQAVWRSYPLRKKILYLGVSAGYIAYRNEAAFFDQFTLTGSSVGMNLSASYDLLVYKGFAVGLNAALTAGLLGKLNYQDGLLERTIELPDGEYESLIRIDGGLGIRFNQ